MSMIIHEKSEKILHISLNRADKKNAINRAMYSQLASVFDDARRDPEVSCVILSAIGEDFCAGNDIADFLQGVASGDYRQDNIEGLPVFQFLKALVYFDKPFIVAAKGKAVGIGTTILLHADHVVLHDSVDLRLPFVTLGLVPEAASSLLLVERIGYLKAYQLFSTQKSLRAESAHSLGLCNHVTAKDPLELALEEAEQLSALPLESLQHTKRLMRNGDRIWEQVVAEGKVFIERLSSDEARSAFMKFMQRG